MSTSGPGPYSSRSIAVKPRASSGVSSGSGLAPLSASWVRKPAVASSSAIVASSGLRSGRYYGAEWSAIALSARPTGWALTGSGHVRRGAGVSIRHVLGESLDGSPQPPEVRGAAQQQLVRCLLVAAQRLQ